jgi:hypothetical protein
MNNLNKRQITFTLTARARHAARARPPRHAHGRAPGTSIKYVREEGRLGGSPRGTTATWTDSGHGVDERRPRRGRTTGSLLRDGGHKLPSWTAGSLLRGQARRARRRGAARARGPCAAARRVESGRVGGRGRRRGDGGWAGGGSARGERAGAGGEGGRAGGRGRLRGDEWRAGGGARSSERVTSEREGALRPRRTKIVVS